jgi:hypothetical protein
MQGHFSIPSNAPKTYFLVGGICHHLATIIFVNQKNDKKMNVHTQQKRWGNPSYVGSSDLLAVIQQLLCRPPNAYGSKPIWSSIIIQKALNMTASVWWWPIL